MREQGNRQMCRISTLVRMIVKVSIPHFAAASRFVDANGIADECKPAKVAEGTTPRTTTEAAKKRWVVARNRRLTPTAGAIRKTAGKELRSSVPSIAAWRRPKAP